MKWRMRRWGNVEEVGAAPERCGLKKMGGGERVWLEFRGGWRGVRRMEC